MIICNHRPVSPRISGLCWHQLMDEAPGTIWWHVTHHTVTVTHHTLSPSDRGKCEQMTQWPTYGLRVLAGRGGVVVIVAGGDVGVGVAPLVLNPCSPGVTMHRLMPVLRPVTKHSLQSILRWAGQCPTCVCKHRMRPGCPWSRKGCMTRIRCSCRWARWGRRRPRVSGSSCNVDIVSIVIVNIRVMSFSFTRGGLTWEMWLVTACHSPPGLAGRGKLATLVGGSGSNFVWARKTPDITKKPLTSETKRTHSHCDSWKIFSMASCCCYSLLFTQSDTKQVTTRRFEDYMSHSMWSER